MLSIFSREATWKLPYGLFCSLIAACCLAFLLQMAWIVPFLEQEDWNHPRKKAQQAFATTIRPFLLNGPYEEVTRLCRTWYLSHHTELLAVRIETAKGKVLCALPDNATPDPAVYDFFKWPVTYPLSQRIYYDADKKQVLATIEAIYATPWYHGLLWAEWPPFATAFFGSAMLVAVYYQRRQRNWRQQVEFPARAIHESVTRILNEWDPHRMNHPRYCSDRTQALRAVPLEQAHPAIRLLHQDVLQVLYSAIGSMLHPASAAPSLDTPASVSVPLHVLHEQLVARICLAYPRAITHQSLRIQTAAPVLLHSVFVAVERAIFLEQCLQALQLAIPQYGCSGTWTLQPLLLPGEKMVTIACWYDPSCDKASLDIPASWRTNSAPVHRTWTDGLQIVHYPDADPSVHPILLFNCMLSGAPDWFRTHIPCAPGGTLIHWDPAGEHAGSPLDPLADWCMQRAQELEGGGVQCRTHRDLAPFMSDPAVIARQPWSHCILHCPSIEWAYQAIDIVQALGIATRSSLCTPHTHDPYLHIACARLGCKLIPANAFTAIPLRPVPVSPAAVLLDSDPHTRKHWEQVAQKQGIRLFSLPELEDGLVSIQDLPRHTPVYIEASRAGLQLCQQLESLQFAAVTLIGCQMMNEPAVNWPPGICTLADKSCPWEGQDA